MSDLPSIPLMSRQTKTFLMERFREMGGEVYVDAEKVRASNKALG